MRVCERERLSGVVAGAAVLALVAGCVSNPLRGQRVARYRPNVANRNVVLAGRMASPPVHAGSTGTAGTGSDAGTGTVATATGRTRALHIGDKVGIHLFGIPELTEIKDVIDDMGNIQLPLIENIMIAGKTTYEAERLIEKAYVEGGYYRKIEVSVVALSVLGRLDEYYVRGEVKQPQRYPWTPELTLTKAIIAAGGFTEYSNRRKVQVNRGKQSWTYDSIKIEQGKAEDPPIKAGDIIIVHRGWV